jgi:pyrroline-5-carboxylate reductase
MLLERDETRAQALRNSGVGQVFSNAAGCLPQADLVILAVKPQDSAVLFADIAPLCEPQQVFLSIMAGVRMDSIQEALGVKKVIRAMPNLPAQTGTGMTVYTGTDDITRLELVMVQNLLNTTGKAIYAEREEAIDAATAISGSGPAYVFYFMQALIEAARNMGFREGEAELLVSQTFHGALDVFAKGEYTCAEWIKRVASRGGTTEAALRSFEGGHLHEKIIAGAVAAQQRAVELGK